MRNNVFFQFARGRAIVRTNAMKNARAARRKLQRLVAEKGASTYYLDRIALEEAARSVVHEVQRARQANRDWRYYRAMHLAYEA